jgi:ABC-2 type transport system ATP-binding protein
MTESSLLSSDRAKAEEEPASHIISIKEITRVFGRMTALDRVSLEIEQGELFGLLGPNGAGKTTLISILSTILSATSGNASVCGFDVGRQQGKVRQSIGIVFQDPSLDEDLSGEENLDFHGRLYGMDSDTRKSRREEVLGLVDLEERRNDLVKTYSGGMRRRLEIARGLMHRPKVLFLDEPTLGLDPQTRRKIWKYLETLKQTHAMTIILTTHYMDEADRLCSRIGIIDRGKIVALGTPGELKAGLGGDLLEMEVGEAGEEFLELLNGADEVGSAVLKDGKLVVTVTGGESFIPKVFDMARNHGVGISSVSLRRPNLEDVFIKLTGREIRDETITEAKERVRLFLTRKRR